MDGRNTAVFPFPLQPANNSRTLASPEDQALPTTLVLTHQGSADYPPNATLIAGAGAAPEQGQRFLFPATQRTAPQHWNNDAYTHYGGNDACTHYGGSTTSSNTATGAIFHNMTETNPGARRRRKRTPYTNNQKVVLEAQFMLQPYITRERKLELSERLNLTERQVNNWFNNRRMKRKKQLKDREQIIQMPLE